MINVIKEEIKITNVLQSKILMTYTFCKVTSKMIEVGLDIVDKTSLPYVEPYKATIKNTN